MRWLWVVAALAACQERSRSTDTVSRTLPTAKQRVAFFCDYEVCPLRPEDVAFHIVFHDNSGGFVPGPDDVDIHAVLRVKPGEVSVWAKGCTPARVDPRPAWLPAMLEGTGWVPTTAPDMLRCGPQTRVIHVREGLIIFSDERH